MNIEEGVGPGVCDASNGIPPDGELAGRKIDILMD